MANAAAQRHQQLKNEANKMAMKIPFFHGDDKEDALDIKEMIRRFENSANAMGLADNVTTVTPQGTCKPTVERESLPELLWWTDTANLSEETTREFVKLNQKKETTCWDTSNNLLEKVAV
jgi:hypothetical protein